MAIEVKSAPFARRWTTCRSLTMDANFLGDVPVTLRKRRSSALWLRPTQRARRSMRTTPRASSILDTAAETKSSGRAFAERATRKFSRAWMRRDWFAASAICSWTRFNSVDLSRMASKGMMPLKNSCTAWRRSAAAPLETKAGHQTRVRQMRMPMCRRKLYDEEPFDEWAQRLAWSLNKDLNNIGVFHTLKQPNFWEPSRRCCSRLAVSRRLKIQESSTPTPYIAAPKTVTRMLFCECLFNSFLPSIETFASV